jgi:hypothetical protein
MLLQIVNQSKSNTQSKGESIPPEFGLETDLVISNQRKNQHWKPVLA